MEQHRSGQDVARRQSSAPHASPVPAERIDLVPTRAPSADIAPTAFDAFFDRVYPASVGLALRVLDRNRTVPDQSRAVAEEIATEAMTKARSKDLHTDEHAIARVMGWTADGCVSHLVGHPGRVQPPQDVTIRDLTDEKDPPDLFGDGGLPLAELQQALSSLRRSDRRVGLVALGCGFSVADTAALLQFSIDEVRSRLMRVGTRLCDGRRFAGRPSAEATPVTPAPDAESLSEGAPW